MNQELPVEVLADHQKYSEGDSMATCRICFGYEDDNLISPCMCKGTHQFVHRSCLDHWRSFMGGFHFSHCTTCKAQFHLRFVELEKDSEGKRKFRRLVARDIFLVFLALQTVIGMMGALAYLYDKQFKHSYNGIWESILSRHPILFYYCKGVLVFIVLLGFLGALIFLPNVGPRPSSESEWKWISTFLLTIFAIMGIVLSLFAVNIITTRIWLRHYHIFVKKRELTKVYEVEDLNGCYIPAKLDPELMKHLKLLELL